MITLIETWTIVTSLVTIASIIVRYTPTQKDDEVLGKIVNILKMISIPLKK